MLNLPELGSVAMWEVTEYFYFIFANNIHKINYNVSAHTHIRSFVCHKANI